MYLGKPVKATQLKQHEVAALQSCMGIVRSFFKSDKHGAWI